MENGFVPTQDAFEIGWKIAPMGDQPQAIEALTQGLSHGVAEQVLMGVTGSGKTFTIANVIARTNRPALILAHNKTLAAQLFQEFKEIFPNNAVEYFISYYDFYQPEAYVPSTDTFIDKEAVVNDDIDKMRHSATRALFERRDVIIVASVSCIYGLGDPESYLGSMILLEVGMPLARDDFQRQLIQMQFERNDIALERGKFRVRGDIIDIVPKHERERAVRVQFWGGKIEKITSIDALRGTSLETLKRVSIWPATHFVTKKEEMDRIIGCIARDLDAQLQAFRAEGRLLEAQRLEQRVLHDLDMMREIGYCQGIENYSRYMEERLVGSPPKTLLDYFPSDYLLIIDESHVTVPQVGAMYRGDRSRKETLVKYGFRLPSALDNRPLMFDEFKARMGQTVYVSATPGPWELERTGGKTVEQIIRPTGLLDPKIEVRPATHQVDDLLSEIQSTIANGGRVLITTLTKKMAEDLTQYYKEIKIKVEYLHSDIDSLSRIEILRDLRRGTFDVLVGINLLREGLDLPEVQLVAILDADKEGFLRSRASLIQTVGRAARNACGRVILYGDSVTDSMKACIDETNRRRALQEAYNTAHGITPQTVIKKIPEEMRRLCNIEWGDDVQGEGEVLLEGEDIKLIRNAKKLEKELQTLNKKMQNFSLKMEFEQAAQCRDRIRFLREQSLKYAEAKT